MAVCQNLVPLVNIKIAGKWMFTPLKMVFIGIDPYPYIYIYTVHTHIYIYIHIYIYTYTCIYTHMCFSVVVQQLPATFFQVCFDSEGFYTFGKTRTKTGQKFVRDQTVALLVNLEEGSPNQNTVLRRNGMEDVVILVSWTHWNNGLVFTGKSTGNHLFFPLNMGLSG